jgi:hypothetical protein
VVCRLKSCRSPKVNDEQPRRKVRVASKSFASQCRMRLTSTAISSTPKGGDAILASEMFDDEETQRQLTEIDEAEPGRYLQVLRADSREGYDDMQDFIDTVSDEHLQELLNVAIQAEAHSAVSRMCWRAIPPSNSGGSTFRQRVLTHAPRVAG